MAAADKKTPEDGAAPVARVAFRSVASEPHEALSGQIIVVCRQPGLRRGGRVHDAMAVYDAGVLSEADLTLMEHELLLEVIEVL